MDGSGQMCKRTWIVTGCIAPVYPLNVYSLGKREMGIDFSAKELNLPALRKIGIRLKVEIHSYRPNECSFDWRGVER